MNMERSPMQLFFFFLLLVLGRSSKAKTTIPFHVGVLLDANSPIGMTGNVAISIAIEDFYVRHRDYSTRLVLHSVDTGNSTLGAVSAALRLLEKKQVHAIVGPQRSAQAAFIADLGSTTQVPIISFSATSPTLTSSHPPYFIRAALNDTSHVNALASLIKAFGWRQVVPIYEDTSFGTGLMPYLIDALRGVNTRVPYHSVLPLAATDDQILKELYKLMTMQTRIFIVHMSPLIGSRLLLRAYEIGMMRKGYVWVTTGRLTSALNFSDPLTVRCMQGVLGIKHYIPPSEAYEEFTSRWERFTERNLDARTDLSIYAVWAYDAIWALAKAVESIIHDKELLFQNAVKSSGPINLESLKVSKIGIKLLDAISRTRFDGIAGEFLLIDNQLQSSKFQIINVNGSGERKIGFWTPHNGLSKILLPINRKQYSTSASDLDVVIWPGKSNSVPKGWQTPTNERILKIGVPITGGFKEFINVQHDHITNATKVTGYCIDVFEAVLNELPYALSYEYIPFEKSGGEMAGTYDELVKGVHEKKFDAAVGDITITADRSNLVDFTLPYTESGVAMIVPVVKDSKKNAWIFWKPLTLDLWLSTLAFIIFTGFVIWVIEHKYNDTNFRGPDQLGTIFYFIFSTLVFSHDEDVKSNFTRIVVITWIFLVLALTSSYTAYLTSILTVVRLAPTVRDMQQLVKNGDIIGYHKGSFLERLLSKDFDSSKMIALETPENYIEALRNGSVSVVFDEIPYIKLVLSRYCFGYTLSEPTHKTAGFGLVFLKGSPLVPDISRAILNVTEGDQFAKLERKWLGGSCISLDSSYDLHGLTVQAFWGLFLITGGTSLIAGSIYLSIPIFKKMVYLSCIARSILEKLKCRGKSISEAVKAKAKSILKRDSTTASRVHASQSPACTCVPLESER